MSDDRSMILDVFNVFYFPLVRKTSDFGDYYIFSVENVT